MRRKLGAENEKRRQWTVEWDSRKARIDFKEAENQWAFNKIGAKGIQGVDTCRCVLGAAQSRLD